MTSQQSHRKDEHVSIAKKFHHSNSLAGFDQVHFIPVTFPEMAIDDVDISTTVGDLSLSIPFYIEAMTGGSEYTKKLNSKLASISKKCGIAMASGSESVALREPQLTETFSIIRKQNPQGLIFANIGADASVSQAQRAINILHADALEIHVNSVQELIMPEGSKSFNWLTHLSDIKKQISIPVIIKEVGFGMSSTTIHSLYNLGIRYINVGGRGGTNFAQIENFRRHKKEMDYFNDWGLTTVESLFEAQKVPKMNIIATGGITNPMEIVKSLYLGADAVGIASQILVKLINDGEDATIEMINDWIIGIKTILTALGAHNINELRKRESVHSLELQNYLKQRK